MARLQMSAVFVLLLALTGSAARTEVRSMASSQTLQSTYEEELGSNKGTPVTRVVNLLKEMQKTLETEMEEDQALYDKLACWCDNNDYEKKQAVEKGEQTITNLEASIEALTAREAELKTTIDELTKDTAADKKSLAEATAIREKQLAEFHGSESDSIQAIENLKAAITVLSKHHGKAPASSVAGGAIFKTEKDSWESFISIHRSKAKQGPWTPEQEAAHIESHLDNFMLTSGFDEVKPVVAEVDAAASSKLLQQTGSSDVSGWSHEDEATFNKAMTATVAFLQGKQGSSYRPAYQSQSGEIFGVLKQMKEEMEADLKAAQELENKRAKEFDELREAKTAEIKDQEKAEERAEDELATTTNNLAEAKEDLEQEKKALAENQKFLKNLEELCNDSNEKFKARKDSRLAEIKAVSETIEILTEDDARDAMTGTYNFLQRSASQEGKRARQRKQAAQLLRSAGLRTGNRDLSHMATSVELDAFTEVKKAIDKMIAQLKTQQEDELKKTDFCRTELQENEMDIKKTEDRQAELEAKSKKLGEDIKALEQRIAEANKEIEQLQYDLQSASEDRKAEHLEFQKTISDQTVTMKVLHKALNRLATFYDNQAFLQRKAKQTPPVPQMEYKPNKGANGVMEMLEKLIQEAQELIVTSKKDENAAEAGYGQIVQDTNDAVAVLQKEVTTKTNVKGDTRKDKRETDSDTMDTVKELEGLMKYNAKLHADCDYVLKNFDARQKGRGEEIEALQQAKQILNGASLA